MAEKETAGKKRRLGDMQLFWRRGVQYGEVDLPFFLIVIALLVMGIVMMFSASYAWAIAEGKEGSYYAVSQMKNAGLGLVLMLLGSHMFDCTEDAKLALRFSFTVNNPPLWKEVHRFAGWLWMLAGLVVAAGAMVTSETTFFSALLALVVLVVPMIYGRSRAGQANG